MFLLKATLAFSSPEASCPHCQTENMAVSMEQPWNPRRPIGRNFHVFLAPAGRKAFACLKNQDSMVQDLAKLAQQRWWS